MISVTQAIETVLRELQPLPPEKVPLLDARGRVLAEDVHAPRDLPPRDNSAMDGYACRGEDLSGEVRLRVVDEVQAGARREQGLGPGEAVKIMTGAPVPPGADVVVPVEDTDGEEGWVRVRKVPALGANIRLAGEDVGAGELVLPRGTPIRPPEVGMLASLGRSQVAVHQRPRVAILATGDEIVELDASVDGGRIFNSNSYGIAAQVAEAGGVPVILGIGRDDPEGLREMLDRAAGADVVITTGGVSMGDYDFVRPVLAASGVELVFWKVGMRPGKPVVFGTKGRVPFFGLPGNPVSAMVGFEEFVRPALRRLQGHRSIFRPVCEALLGGEAGPVKGKAGRVEFVRCRVERDGEQLRVVSTKKRSSGILKTLVEANALLILSESSPEAVPGDRVRVQLYDLGFLEGERPGLSGPE
ncbi:MAG: gephyrin-like molybdotransferase Glp [Deferrisomatales bacterium]